MNSSLTSIYRWLHKKPEPILETENIDQAIKELKELNAQQTNYLNAVKQPDILRSLVISMNAGRNT
jgi:hypothetical protein